MIGLVKTRADQPESHMGEEGLEMEAIYDWIRNLAFFFIFMTAILNILPENQYRKYVHFFLGIVLLILLSVPLLKLVNLDTVLDDKVISETLEEELKSSRNAAYSVEGIQEDLLKDAYAEEIEGQIRDMFEKQDIRVDEIEVTIKGEDNLQVERISVRTGNMQESLYREDADDMNRNFQRRLDAAKTKLSQVYEVDESHIDISR